MNEILLSIIIPAYNSGRFLPATLSMLVQQGLDDCEVIIINDGSIDSTESICRDFSNRCSEIRFVSQENQGVSAARNRGIEESHGRYLYFFDSDDSLTDGSLDFFRSILSRHDDNTTPELFVFSYELHRLDGVVKHLFSNKLHKTKIYDDTIKKYFFAKKIPWHICSCVFDRNFIVDNNILFPNGIKIGEDIVFMIQAITAAKCLYYHNRLCFIYQIRADSVMQGYKSYSMDRMKSFEIVRDAILKNSTAYATVKKEVNFFIANLYLANLVAYIKADVKDRKINSIFMQNKCFLYKRLSGRFINYGALCIARCIPLRIVFAILKYSV
ncbi:glycosyltransferase [Treponema vincentii]|uniref:Glycosyltransferase n=1 Tax=Treponema vincentii TaxID=69710 RepID=A0A6P1XYZ3_9SPIR|nr:glycosyltransferase [Treponema vincentii]QHX42565.1 glycosyltransferase [Treponema vincentii]